jgi:hypothetical protein
MNVVTKSLELQAAVGRRARLAAEQARDGTRRSRGEAAAAGVVGSGLLLALLSLAGRGAVRRLLDARLAREARRRKDALRRFFDDDDGGADGDEGDGVGARRMGAVF